MMSTTAHSSISLPAVLEEQSLSLRGRGSSGTPSGEILQAAADILRSRLPREFLDPFSPTDARYQAVAAVLRAAIAEARQAGSLLSQLDTDLSTLKAVYAQTIGWGPAQRYLDDPGVVEVKIAGKRILVQEVGQPSIVVEECFADEREVTDRAKILADLLGIRLDANNPQQTLPLDHGTRMHATIYPCSTNGPLICIRRGRSYPWDINDLIGRGSLDEATADILRFLVQARCSFLIVGSTASGKTTMLEALANSWVPNSHIVTIEDNCQEITIKPSFVWTRQAVDTTQKPDGFSFVAREGLRQTPGLLLPGETRSYEAGAFLSLLTSDHAVITTIHALSGADGLQRFASCAALPNAYMYAGRGADALRDTVHTFDAVISVEFVADIGRRVISEIVIPERVQASDGGLIAQVIPLVTQDVNPETGDIMWRTHARIVNDELVWTDGSSQRTPPRLVKKFKRARTARAMRLIAPSIDVAAAAVQRAEGFLVGGQGARALEALKDAWQQRNDPKVLQTAQRALALMPDLHQACIATANELTRKLYGAMDASQWQLAEAIFNDILSQLEWAAASPPPAGWDSIRRQLDTARAAHTLACELLAEATTLLEGGQCRSALDILDRFDRSPRFVEPSVQYDLMNARVQALDVLVDRADAAPEALATARAQLEGLAAVIASAKSTTTQSGASQ
jgi:pilus assembly protein CpaF